MAKMYATMKSVPGCQEKMRKTMTAARYGGKWIPVGCSAQTSP